MLVTPKMVRDADLKDLIKFLREESTWHPETGACWNLLVRAAKELEDRIGAR